jgi:type I restriction enzyme R subunit
MTYNEAETRYYLIGPVLRGKGYDDHQWLKLETPAPVEATGAKGRRRKGNGTTDYLLCIRVGGMLRALPVAVLEAKKETKDPFKGMQQAKGYADCRRYDVKYVFATKVKVDTFQVPDSQRRFLETGILRRNVPYRRVEHEDPGQKKSVHTL